VTNEIYTANPHTTKNIPHYLDIKIFLVILTSTTNSAILKEACRFRSLRHTKDGAIVCRTASCCWAISIYCV